MILTLLLTAPWYLLGSPVGPQAAPAPQAPAPAATAAGPGHLGVPLDSRGWPVVPEAPSAGFEALPEGPPGAGRDPARRSAEPLPSPSSSSLLASGRGDQAILPSNREDWQGLVEAVGTSAAFEALGRISVWWRITVHGPQGEAIGLRELTQISDVRFPERDRLEFTDGRVCGRDGASVFAERHGMPWPTLVEAATEELALFGLHVRLPWALLDRRAYAVAGADSQTDGEGVRRVRLLRRGKDGAMGPPETTPATDRFELVLPRAVGAPREFSYELAGSGRRRRVLLEDWRSVQSVRMPFRRVYVDASGQPTTTLEVLRVETGGQAGERDFRLH